jgi:electron-transferring-flavoprotein dehydrogenase
MDPVDVLVVGAGPAGLAAAIRLKQQMKLSQKDVSVMVLDKAPYPGAHSLSGAVLEAGCLDELLPGWRQREGSFVSEMTPVTRDEMYFLSSGRALRLPSSLVPRGMRHVGDHVVSLTRLVEWLTREASKEGVDVYHGVSVASLIWEGSTVRGVRLTDAGLDKEGRKGANYAAGEEVRAKVTVLADGGSGVLAREFSSRGPGGRNPQVYSIGIKQVLGFPAGQGPGKGRVIHTLGFPCPPDVFGGGLLYGMGDGKVALGLILGLDWRYTDLDPQKELEYFKAHPFMAGLLKGARVLEAGAKIIPEGGFFAIPRLWGQGALVAGDAAGFVNMEEVKGLHYALLSGMAAADAIAGSFARGDEAGPDLGAYEDNLRSRGVWRDMRHARNFRACFQWGILAGAPLSKVQNFLPRLGMREDRAATRKGACLKRAFTPALNRAEFAALSATHHREDELSHIVIREPEICARCLKELSGPCTAFCPVEVYRAKGAGITVSPSNCIHCGTCSVKCPFDNIAWRPPEGGEGPRYKSM